MTEKLATPNAQDLLRHFTLVLGVEFDAPADLMDAAQAAIEGCKGWAMYSQVEREHRLIALVNSKLKLNKHRFQEFLDRAAEGKIFLNYHDKVELLECLDYRDKPRFERFLEQRGYDSRLSALFRPITVNESLAGLRELLRTGTVNRSDARKCDLSERQTEILRSLFGSYVFHSFPEQALHCYFNQDCHSDYESDFYHHLVTFQPKVLHRDCAMVLLCLDQDLIQGFSGVQLRDALCSFVRGTYDRLANHCFFAVLVTAFREGDEAGQWRLFSDLIVYAEKHREVHLNAGYFRPNDIKKSTAAHIPGLDVAAAQFDLANEGFFFRDCFVLNPTAVGEDTNKTTSQAVDLLLLFEKNERDETVIPCPACRSWQVLGNSYPTLGVRSWECRNPICPNRSAFDRGNRYSLASIVKQEAIKSDADQIPGSSLRNWKLDVAFGVDHNAVVDMLIRHFTLHGDTAVIVDGGQSTQQRHGRRILHEKFKPTFSEAGAYHNFLNASLFKRFLIDREEPHPTVPAKIRHKVRSADVYQGDCFEVLAAFEESSIDAAVTSPPYYNARSYSVWPNIYCYLYDMYNSARQVFRVLKPGSIYLFNIFDYFDNENTIVLSAMGKKRMILGAYIINIFRRIGFELSGNVVWYKGEIEGKRNFNQGNRSPYYQFPFNCWEHGLVFRKPGRPERTYSFPTILDAKPVIKMVRGENVLGHTAPFPTAIPLLLISQMARGDCVLDPFSGSMTTGRTAHKHGLKSVSIELHKVYCELGIRLLDQEDRDDVDLFRKAS